jgi:hypothetical protein
MMMNHELVRRIQHLAEFDHRSRTIRFPDCSFLFRKVFDELVVQVGADDRFEMVREVRGGAGKSVIIYYRARLASVPDRSLCEGPYGEVRKQAEAVAALFDLPLADLTSYGEDVRSPSGFNLKILAKARGGEEEPEATSRAEHPRIEIKETPYQLTIMLPGSGFYSLPGMLLSVGGILIIFLFWTPFYVLGFDDWTVYLAPLAIAIPAFIKAAALVKTQEVITVDPDKLTVEHDLARLERKTKAVFPLALIEDLLVPAARNAIKPPGIKIASDDDMVTIGKHLSEPEMRFVVAEILRFLRKGPAHAEGVAGLERVVIRRGWAAKEIAILVALILFMLMVLSFPLIGLIARG